MDLPLKRTFDVVLAAVGLVLTLPVSALISFLIKLEDGGPVLYAQERVGKEGKLFQSYKFRSMSNRQSSGEFVSPAERGPSQVLGVGSLIRPMALDELPQLWNVLKGDMSLVGPRPLVPREIEEASGNASDCDAGPGVVEERQSVRPGLTGLAQTSVPKDAPYEEKFRLDLRYIRNRNLWLDLRLVALSIWISLRAGWPEVGHTQAG